jgi:hypothetical protein
MSRRFLPHLRRCRLLFALALCAWLMLAGMAWAQSGCCESMAGSAHAAMAGGHGATHDMSQQHAHQHHHADAWPGDCSCAHAPATLPRVAALDMPVRLPHGDVSPAAVGDAPQPPAKPPLRPPAA